MIPNDLTKFKSSTLYTVPTPILNSYLEFVINSMAFLDSIVLNLISKFTIPESNKHFAKSKALVESLMVNTDMILLFLINT